MTTSERPRHLRERLIRELDQASERVIPRVRHTACELSPALSDRLGAEVWLKLENLQLTGSFKVRGATNKILTLTRSERARGVATASSGNHGLAVAHAASELAVAATVFLPRGTSAAKRRALGRTAARLRYAGDDVADTEDRARGWARERGLAYIPPYNDLAVIAGQGTLGVELLEDVPAADVIFASVGGGGLIAGVAAAVKSKRPEVVVVGAQPARSDVMYRSVAAGCIVPLASRPTLSDGTAGGIEADSITLPLCRELVDRFVRVGEDRIARAMREILEHHHLAVEGAAGVALAAALKCRAELRGKVVVIVLCGANVSLETLRSVLG